MKTKLTTLEQVEQFISKANELLHYPNIENGTLTYTEIPEITEIKDEEGNVIESYYEIEITNELNETMIEIALKEMIL